MKQCDVFFLTGGNEKEMVDMFVNSQPQLQVLRDLIVSGSVCFIGGCGGAMAAGQFWTPPPENASPPIRMLNLLNNVDVGVDEPDYAAYARKTLTPYIHLTQRVAALVCGGETSAIFIQRNGKSK